MTTRLVLTAPEGGVIGLPLPIGAFSYSVVTHDVGVLQVCIGREWASQIDYEQRIEVYRRIEPLPLYRVRSYFVEIVDEVTDEKQREALLLTCLDANALLAWRDIYAFSKSSQATKSDHADDIMRAYVREQLGTTATNPLDAAYFTVEADSHEGPALSVSNAWTNLMQALQGISDEAEGAGSRVYFQMRDGQGAAQYNFHTSITCPGTDRSLSSGNPLLVGLSYGNVTRVVRSRDASEEVNHVVAIGAGEGTARKTGEYIDQTTATRSVWSRKKVVYTETSLNTTTALASSAKRAVVKGKARERIIVTLADAPGFRYGYDWLAGDRLTVTHNAVDYTGIVKAVTWNVDDNGAEHLDAKLEIVL